MDNSLEGIQLLLKKYKERKEQLTAELEDLKSELQEIDGKLFAFNTTLDSLREEGLSREETATALAEISERYADMQKNEAILDVLNSDPEKAWKAKEIVESLIKNGLKTESKNLLRDVYNELSRLVNAKDARVVIIKKRGKRRGQRVGTGYQVKKEDATVQVIQIKKEAYPQPVEGSSTPS